jgi:predicted HTH transcriptional regulator
MMEAYGAIVRVKGHGKGRFVFAKRFMSGHAPTNLQSRDTVNETENRVAAAVLPHEAINEAIKNEPGINKPRLLERLGKSKATIERAIAILIADGRIEHRGSNKTGGYYPKNAE